MSQILRFGDGRPVDVPAGLLDALDTSLCVSDGDATEFGLDGDQAALLEAVCFTPRGATVVTSSKAVADARNVMDGMVLDWNSECTVCAPGADGDTFCLRCQFIVIRDWLDRLLDAAGHTRSPYLDALDYDPAHEWERRWAAES